MDAPNDPPERVLSEITAVRRRTRRRVHGGAWLPAGAVAVLLLLSIGLYRYPFGRPTSLDAGYPFWAGLPDEQRSPVASYLFWFVGIPVMFAGSAWWYRRRSARLGLRVGWRAFVVAGLAALALLAVLAAMPHGRSVGPAVPPWQAVLTPLLPLAVAVLALGWVERSAALLAIGCWIGLLAWWLCGTFPLGHFPGWVDRVLNGGGGPGLGGSLALRPGHYLLVMALPLVVFAVARAAGAAYHASRRGPA